MIKVSRIRIKNSKVLKLRLLKGKQYKDALYKRCGKNKFFKKVLILDTDLTKSKRFSTYDSKPAFSAEIIEAVLGANLDNRKGILFKCPPKGQPAFKIID